MEAGKKSDFMYLLSLKKEFDKLCSKEGALSESELKSLERMLPFPSFCLRQISGIATLPNSSIVPICTNKGRFCNTIVSVALVHTSKQSDKRMQAKEILSSRN